MPRRARRDRRRTVELTPARHLALTIGPDPLGDEPDDVLLSVYAAHRDRLLEEERRGARPWAWWAWEPSVPDELRGERPALHLVEDDDAEPRQDDDDELEDRRAEWLATNAA